MNDDPTLLRRYASGRAEEAFAEFVRRHLPLVYSAALRRLGGDTHAAEDVAQMVFCAVARDARRLSQHAMLTGWLYRATRNAVIDVVRANQRRRGREKEAVTMAELSSDIAETADWSRLGPVLDAAMDNLRAADREAVLLRFFQNRPFAEIGAGLGLSEDAARKRVERALDKLRTRLRRHGIGSTSAALASVLASGTVSAAPAGLAASVTGAALATGGSAVAAAAFLTVSKLHVGIAAVVLAGAATGLISQQRSLSAWHQTANGARQQVAQLTMENTALAVARTEAEAKSTALARAHAEAAAEARRLRAELNALQPGESVSMRPVATSGVASRPTAATDPASAGELGPLPDTPEIRKRKEVWHRRYDPFFEQRGMTKADGDRFVELKIHQEIARADFQAAVRAANVRGDSSAVQALRAKDDRGVTRGLLELLGKEGYAAYTAYELSSSFRMGYVEPVQSELARANVPLSPGQAEQLLAIFAANTRYVQAQPTDIGTTAVIDWDGVVTQCDGILTPPQIAALQTHARRRQPAQRPP